MRFDPQYLVGAPSAKNRRSEFTAWLKTALPGDRFVYWRGDLATARTRYRNLHFLACDAWSAYEAGNVLLFQRKHGFNNYAYEAVFR